MTCKTCKNFRACAEETAWMHNPHKDWSFVSNSRSHFSGASVSPTGYAFPFNQRPVFALTDARITPKKAEHVLDRSICKPATEWCKRVKIKATGADPLFIAGAVYGAFTQSAWWLVVIPLVIASWVLNPRWDSANGWRFFHD